MFVNVRVGTSKVQGNPPPYDPWVHEDFHENRTKNQGPDTARIFNSAKDSDAFLRLLADRTGLL